MTEPVLESFLHVCIIVLYPDIQSVKSNYPFYF